MHRTAPNATRPATDSDFEGMAEKLFTPSRWESQRGYEATALIHGHCVVVAYQPDDDGYAGWLDGSRYIGVDHDPTRGTTFTEIFYFLSKQKTILRFRAEPLSALLDKVVIRDGVPALPEPITPSLGTEYWHHLHDASTDGYRSPATAMMEHLPEYYTRTGSHYIKQFIRIAMMDPRNLP